MKERASMTRRDFLTGQSLTDGIPAWQHSSSAVISVLPRHTDEVVERLAAMEGVEVHAAQASKIVVTIEGPSVGALGERLTQISLLDGVITANLVFEHIYSDEGDPQ
ncbi:glutamate synthase [Pseudaminobacter arsenicus]|uniref:Chaperone NapD n=1 Tax=Borborobacter arsenicus TaxID=1851146 RepID=A0A432VAV4_9HYPH|nr:chaperone NapD [Pseudaminobacter arsenicus]RUM99223.1 glutamate synthase [Pseudaminobacter arsenicus]